MLMWAMSDRAIPRSFRFMEGFGVHTFRLVNADGESTFVKFHWKPKLGMQSVVWNEAVKINGADPDFHRRDLWDAIQAGDLPGVGARPPAVRRRLRRPVRVRRARRDEDHPRGARADPARRPARARPRRRQLLRRDRAGRVLHAEHRPRHRLHQRSAAPGPQLLVPRHPAEAARQPQLHAPARSTRRSARSRTFQQDGHMAIDEPDGARELRAELLGPRDGGPARIPERGSRRSRRPSGGRSGGSASETFADHYSQARQFYVSQTPVEQQHIADAFVFELSKVERPDIRARMVAQPAQRRRGPRRSRRRRARPRRAARPVDAGPATPVTDLPPSPALSILANGPDSFEGRKVGVLVTDGADAALARRRCSAAVAGGGRDRRADRAQGRRLHARATASDRGEAEDRRRTVGALRRSRDCSSRREGAPTLADDAGGDRLRGRRLRALQVHRIRGLRRAAARGCWRESGRGRARRRRRSRRCGRLRVERRGPARLVGAGARPSDVVRNRPRGQGARSTMKAFALNCTLKASPAPSSTDVLLDDIEKQLAPRRRPDPRAGRRPRRRGRA